MTSTPTMDRIHRCIVLSKVHGLGQSPMWWLSKMAGLHKNAPNIGEFITEFEGRERVMYWLDTWESKLRDPEWVEDKRRMFNTPKPERKP